MSKQAPFQLMNKVGYSLIIGIFFSLFQTALFTHFLFLSLSPALAIILLECRRELALILAFLLGLFLDLICSTPFGLYALVFTLATALCERHKQLFPIGLVGVFLYTAEISIACQLLEVIALAFLQHAPVLSFKWLFTDLILMPCIDGVYGVVFFALPIKAFQMLQLHIKLKPLLKKR